MVSAVTRYSIALSKVLLASNKSNFFYSTMSASAVNGDHTQTSTKSKIDSEHPPLSYKQSFSQWIESKPLTYYEDQVLRLIPFYPDGDATRTTKLIDTAIDSKGNYIHELYIENTETPLNNEERHIVLVHGYGASLGFFYRNFDGMSSIKGVKIHAIDLLGFGLSSRSKFPKYDVQTIKDIKKTEDYFVDSIEEWRKKRNLSSFVLIGHSLGGYLSSCYTLKHQERVEKLVLISPVGVERSEYSLLGNTESSNLLDRPDQHSHTATTDGPEVANEYYESQSQAISPTLSNSSSESEIEAKMGQERRTPRLPKLLIKLWERHTSPFSFVRGFGPLGPKFVSGWSFSRFGALTSQEDLMLIHKYAYKTFTAKGSGEYALTRILAPGALARLPLLDRLPGNLKVPSLWLYGERDWMSKETGKECVDDINTVANKKIAKFKIINRAGHHVYLDNVEDFNASLAKFLAWY